MVLPPGTILQLMHLRQRIVEIPPGRFIEIGPGSGEITRLLLDHGWAGSSYDLEETTIAHLRARFAEEIGDRRFTPILGDYLESKPSPEGVDLVISCMVMEHLEDDAQTSFMKKSAGHLKTSGLMIGLVPASPKHWGIEDDIAGHCRRYTRESIQSLVNHCGWQLQHLAGLTFPVSNFLLPLSNFLVRRSEHSLLALSHLDRTKLSGRRAVKFKTHFPSVFGILLNRYTLFPLYILQCLYSKSDSALILYFEACPARQNQSITVS